MRYNAMIALNPDTTALVLIDLQKGIATDATQPRPGREVVATAQDLAARFRAAGAPVVLVHVDFGPGNALAPGQNVDRPALAGRTFPPDWSEFVDGLRRDGDIVVTKRQWGAFTGTDLDLQLRRRGIRTIVLAGIATNFGVESTARTAWELSYDVVVAEDACASRTADLHAFAIEYILPQIARVVLSADVSLLS